MIVQPLSAFIAQGTFALGIGTAEVAPEELLAVRGMTAAAGQAMAAVAIAEHYMVADLQPFDLRADGLDHTGAFMAQHCRQWHRIVLVTHDHVGMAHACGDDAYQYFVRARCTDTCGFQGERGSFATGDGCGDGIVGSCIHCYCPLPVKEGRPGLRP
ncbi:hypothetical protein D3C84_658860 [compost metagenome]